MFTKPRNNYIYRKYSEVESLIREADILLYRGKGISSFLLKKASRGRHSHAAIASWKYSKNEQGIFVPTVLECIEFREWMGGRTVSLRTQIEEYSGTIDVFRPSRKIQLFDAERPEGYWVNLNPLEVTNCMRKMTGLPYGWKRIIKLAGHHMLGLRLINTVNVDDEWVANTYPVCSTAVSRSVRKGYADPVHWLADSHTEPPDLARSSMFSYMYTLVDDDDKDFDNYFK